MLYILCGLIGSGKTTYARSNFKYFTDLDFMNEYARKIDQIKWTEKLLNKNIDVCHITTYPTEEEQRILRQYIPRYLLIDTELNQCKTNILIRGRSRDINNLQSVFEVNSELYKKLSLKNDYFDKIKIF